MKKSIVIIVILAAVFTAFKSSKKETVFLNEEVKINLNYEADNVDVTASVLNWKG